DQLDELRGLLRIGIQWNTEVTLAGCGHLISQVYCSALPVAYSPLSPSAWEPFARFILEALYEATFCAAAVSATASDGATIYLTAVGGGAFGNPSQWIFAALERALDLHRTTALDVAIISFRSPNPLVDRLQSRC